MSLMGLDVGSSRCKAVVFNGSGQVLADAVEEYTAEVREPSLVEMDPDTLWRAAASAIRAAAGATRDDPVAAIGISSHGESFVPVDAAGEAMRPMIMNADNRATEETEWWAAHVGRGRVFELTGMTLQSIYPVMKLQWLKNHETDLFSSAARFLGVSDYLLLKLGFEPRIPHSLACRFMAFDVRRLEWSQEILGELGLPADRLPVPAPAGTVVGRISPTLGADLGLSPGVPVVVAGHDQPCGAAGVGAISAGAVAASLGTYECVIAVVGEPTLEESALAGSLDSYCHVVPGRYITIAYFPAGIMVKWFCDNFCGEDAARARESGTDLHSYLESRIPAGPTGLCVLPHLIGSGTPHFDPRAAAAIAGLTATSDRYQIYRGILEGIACELAIVADQLAGAVGPFGAVRATGGGAYSRLGLALRAAITGRRMMAFRTQEAVCLGAALTAGVATGAYADFEEAVAAAVQVAETVEPDEQLARAYARQIAQYRSLYPALRPMREA